MTLEELHEQIAARGVPVLTVRQVGARAQAAYAAYATDEQKGEGDALAEAWRPPSPAEQARAQALGMLARAGDPTQKLIRAVALAILDEVNALRAGQPQTPPRAARTWEELKLAIQAKLEGGYAD